MAIKFYGEEYDQVTYKVNIKLAATLHPVLVLIENSAFIFHHCSSSIIFGA